jgi:hypothetical protein
MAPLPDVSQLADILDKFQTLLGQAQMHVLDEAVREKLGLLSAQMAESQGNLMTTYPQAMAGLQQRMDGAKQKAQATLDEVEQLRKQAAESEQARKKPEGQLAEEEPLDLTLGPKLRLELLERFGDGPKKKPDSATQTLSRSELFELMRQWGVLK